MEQPEMAICNLVCTVDFDSTEETTIMHSMAYCPTSAAADLWQAEKID